MKKATATSPDADVTDLYEQFCGLREQLIVAEIRKMCGIGSTTVDLSG